MSDHLSEQQRTWSPGQAVTPGECGCVHDSPDFVSAGQRELEARSHERVNRHVAPCLSCQAGLCAEHGPATTATTTGRVVDGARWIAVEYALPCGPARVYLHLAVMEDGRRTFEAGSYKGGEWSFDNDLRPRARVTHWLRIPDLPLAPPAPAAEAPRKGSKAWAIQEACRIVGIAFHGIAEYDEASDCFCSESPRQDYRNGGQALAFVEAAVREKLAREKAPAPAVEATEEMSDSVAAALIGMIAPQRGEDSDDRYSRERAIGELLDGIAALRTRAREAEEREKDALRQRDNVMASFRAEKRDREIAQARNRLWDLTRDDCWAWEGGADAPPEANHLDTLIAPVFIRPEVLLAIFRERDEAREQRDNALTQLSDAKTFVYCPECDSAKVAIDTDGSCATCGTEALVTDVRARLRNDHQRLGAIEDEMRRFTDEKNTALVAANARAEEHLVRKQQAESRAETGAQRLAAAEAEVASLKAENEARLDVATEHRKRFRLRAEAAEAEVKRLRLAYDDPSLDATDGAHPAWWRGQYHGSWKAAEVIDKAFDEPLPIDSGYGEQIESVRQRVAALRERCRRLEEAGSVLRNLARRFRSTVYGPEEIDRAIDAFGAALDAPAAGGGKA